MGTEHEERRRERVGGPPRAGETGAAPGRRTLTDGLADDVAGAERSTAEHGTTRAVPRMELGRGGTGTTAPGFAADPDRCAERFSTEFRAQLHVFEEGDTRPAAERGPQDTAARTPVTEASGAVISAARLAQLFTPGQLAKIDQFISDRRIPDRLFNGDDVGGTATPQQRTMIAGHILALGVYVPGSYAQRLHARMCGHWAQLVLHYAGAGQGSGAGVIESFDHTGGLSLSVADRDDGDLTGRTRTATTLRSAAVEEGSTAEFRFEGIAREQYDAIVPGDWLWIYNESGSRGGNHSVIFTRWAGPWQYAMPGGEVSEDAASGGVPFRRAFTMSQGSPGAGGIEEARILGLRRVPCRGGHVAPIVRVMHVDESTRPARTVEDLVALLGTGSEAERNQRLIDRLTGHGRRGGPEGHAGESAYDWQGLISHLRARNTTLIDQLVEVLRDGERITPGQVQMFRDTNAGTHHDPQAGTVGVLVRLHQRLTNLLAQARALGAGRERARERVDAAHDANVEALRPERERLRARLAEHDATLHQLQQQHQALTERASGPDTASALRAARSERGSRRPELRRRLRRARTPEERRALQEEIAALDHAFEEARDADAAHRREESATERQESRLLRLIQREERLHDDVQHDLDRLEGREGYMMAADGVHRDTFQGRGDVRVTGLLADLDPAAPLASFVRSAP